MFVGKDRSLHSGRLRPYPQTLDKAGKAYQEQTLYHENP